MIFLRSFIFFFHIFSFVQSKMLLIETEGNVEKGKINNHPKELENGNDYWDDSSEYDEYNQYGQRRNPDSSPLIYNQYSDEEWDDDLYGDAYSSKADDIYKDDDEYNYFGGKFLFSALNYVD